jgi:hypothetical protein
MDVCTGAGKYLSHIYSMDNNYIENFGEMPYPVLMLK